MKRGGIQSDQNRIPCLSKISFIFFTSPIWVTTVSWYFPSTNRWAHAGKFPPLFFFLAAEVNPSPIFAVAPWFISLTSTAGCATRNPNFFFLFIPLQQDSQYLETFFFSFLFLFSQCPGSSVEEVAGKCCFIIIKFTLVEAVKRSDRGRRERGGGGGEMVYSLSTL